MNRFNTTKMDSKGRILVPFYIRDFLDLNEGNEFVLICNGKKELKVYPIDDEENVQVKLVLKNHLALSEAMKVMNQHKVDVLVSTCETLERGKKVKWSGMVDFSSCENLKNFKDELSKLNPVENVEIDKK